MTTMRAAVINETGAPDVLVLAEIDMPAKVNAEFLIKVEAAGINPIEAKTRAGRGVIAGIRNFPAVLGSDFSGVVVEAPYEAHPFQPGTEVYGMAPAPRVASGSYAEYIAVQALSVAKKPANLSHVEAAGVPLAAMTAWGAVVDVARAHEGQRILIHAGSGGVGHFAVQFAAYFGAHVIATGSTRNLGWLRDLGATEVIDYTSTRFEQQVSDVDAVIDLIGNVHDDTGTRSLATMRPGGLLVNVPTGSWPTFMTDAAAAGMRSTSYKVSPSASTLEVITRLIEAGDVRVHVDEVFPLSDAAEAHQALERGHTRGKIVLAVTES
ncbi:NADP-dependent oxidoreductase [Salinibacterium sp. ZJ450]|uniref:NADP-dependent oxidoreductase n=1 Tax=Salinibacterium sp. ZJ450 TaxID=2708338 RepID=UPI00351D0D38